MDFLDSVYISIATPDRPPLTAVLGVLIGFVTISMVVMVTVLTTVEYITSLLVLRAIFVVAILAHMIATMVIFAAMEPYA